MKITKVIRTVSVLLFLEVHLVAAHVKTLQVLRKECNNGELEGCQQKEETNDRTRLTQTNVQNSQILPSEPYQSQNNHKYKSQTVPPGPSRPEVIDLNRPEIVPPEPKPSRPGVIDLNKPVLYQPGHDHQHKPQILPPGPSRPEVVDLNRPEIVPPEPKPSRPGVIDLNKPVLYKPGHDHQHKPQILPPGPSRPEVIDLNIPEIVPPEPKPSRPGVIDLNKPVLYKPGHDHQHKPQILPPGPSRPEVIDLNRPEIVPPEPKPSRPGVIDLNKPVLYQPGHDHAPHTTSSLYRTIITMHHTPPALYTEQ
uniref:Surface antigen-2 n=1 Tax=Tachypleus tridentatus TaxID=6853 RepID=Q8MY67_TACTR|nr:surface antigen-2 [Tachypleus tridentatus]